MISKFRKLRSGFFLRKRAWVMEENPYVDEEYPPTNEEVIKRSHALTASRVDHIELQPRIVYKYPGSGDDTTAMYGPWGE